MNYGKFLYLKQGLWSPITYTDITLEIHLLPTTISSRKFTASNTCSGVLFVMFTYINFKNPNKTLNLSLNWMKFCQSLAYFFYVSIFLLLENYLYHVDINIYNQLLTAVRNTSVMKF